MGTTITGEGGFKVPCQEKQEEDARNRKRQEVSAAGGWAVGYFR